MIQKIIASIVIYSLCFSAFVHTYAEDVSHLWKYAQYAPSLEQLIPSLWNEKLNSLDYKLTTLQGQVSGDAWALVDYVLELIDTELALRASETVNTINISEKDKARDAILSLQSHIKRETIAMIEAVLNSWIKMTHIKETGDFSLDFDYNIQELWWWKWGISLSDYSSTTHLFDQSFSSSLEAFLENSMQWYSAKMSLSSNIEIISKSGNIYIKIQNTSIDDGWSGMEIAISPYIEKLEELARDNIYLTWRNADAEIFENMISNFSVENIYSELNTIFDTPLLEAISVEDGVYRIVPSKHFCDTGKRLQNIFDPFYGQECSDGQYKDLKDAAMRDTPINLTTGANNTLWTQEDSSIMSITWSRFGIVSAIADLQDEDMTGEIEFIPGESIIFNIDSPEIFTEFFIEFQDSHISKLWYDAHIPWEDTIISMSYANWYIDWSIKVIQADMDVDCTFTWALQSTNGDVKMHCEYDFPYELSPGVENMDLDITLIYDLQNNKNNADINLRITAGDDNYGNITITNTGTKTYIQAWEIQAPTKTKDIEEFLEEIYTEQFDDEGYYY